MDYVKSLTAGAVMLFLPLVLFADPLDRDADGLPDIWQQRYSAAHLLPDHDDDSDGYSNSAESLAGTNPFDASDHPQFTQMLADPTGELVTLSFPTQSGKLY